MREPVEVSITREELTVVSYPGPDRSVKQKELAAGRAMSRRYRNRRIGEFLKELDLTEGRGTGVPKILRAMRDNGSPPPAFKFDEDHSYFATVLPVHPQALASQAESRAESLPRRVLALLQGGELSKSSLASQLGLSSVTGQLNRAVAALLADKLVEFTLADKPGSRLQKYRLTQTGRATLAKTKDPSRRTPLSSLGPKRKRRSTKK